MERCISLAGLAVALSAAGSAVGVRAQEATTYIYDAQGRVVSVQISGGPENGTATTYTYDAAGNRTNVTVNGAANGSDPGDGASVPRTGFVVVPLNGFTVIPFRR